MPGSTRLACALRLPPARMLPTLAASAFLAFCPVAYADVLYLTSGGSLEGDILNTSDAENYRVRTVLGPVTVQRDAVIRVEAAPSIFAEYDARRGMMRDTAAEHVELAQWCAERGFNLERRVHLRRALELDPDCAGARSALGYVRVGGLWVDGRAVVEKPAARPAAESRSDAPAPGEGEELTRAIQIQWARRIRAIRTNSVDTGLADLIERGRREILAIRDPLAVLPLARELSSGPPAARELLVEALAAFPGDEATVNLAVLALVDDDRRVRAAALSELVKRADPRITPQFRRALRSDSDELIKRAAVALGRLRCRPAVAELIPLLTVRRIKEVEVPVYAFLGEFAGQVASPVNVVVAGRAVAYSPQVGVVATGVSLGVSSTIQERDVTVYRSEVLDALRLITGEDFGFDEAAWRRWYEEQKP